MRKMKNFITLSDKCMEFQNTVCKCLVTVNNCVTQMEYSS